jgi:hypothetical protein
MGNCCVTGGSSIEPVWADRASNRAAREKEAVQEEAAERAEMEREAQKYMELWDQANGVTFGTLPQRSTGHDGHFPGIQTPIKQ